MSSRLGYRIAKRTLDLAVSLTALILLSPVLLLVALLVRLKLGSPVLFRQERAGLQGRPFFIFKFRTMTDDRDADGKLLPDADRLPSIGQLLRSTSLDELPQLLNVALGQMSLVGPRPLYVKYIPRYSEAQKRRLLVPPGITGLAQVSGRNALSWDDRFALDTRYVDEASLFLDLRILIQTIQKVVHRDGISAEGQATMSEFLGASLEQPHA